MHEEAHAAIDGIPELSQQSFVGGGWSIGVSNPGMYRLQSGAWVQWNNWL